MGFVFFVILICAVLGAASYYISRRIYQGLKSFSVPINFIAVLVAISFMTLVMVMGFAGSMLPFPDSVKEIISTVAFCWMGIFIYLLIFCLLVDAIYFILKLCRVGFTAHKLCRGISLALVVVLTASTSVYGFCNAKNINHVSYTVSMPHGENISDMRIVMISDLHLGAVGSEERLGDIVGQINSLKPDLVCISGDFFDTDFAAIRDVEAAKTKLRGISSTYGVYACLGNHDGGQTFSQMKEFLTDSNITLLNDEYSIINHSLLLVGRADASPIGGYEDHKRKELSEFLKRPNGLPIIVMDHNPSGFDDYNDDTYLVLSGHTHDGQMFPANIITDMMYTTDYGYYKNPKNGAQMIISSGVGYWGIPMRVGTGSEIVSITVKGK